MKLFTNLGLTTPYMVIICLIYWCYSRQLGARLGIFLVASACFNETLKQFIQAPRPYWVSSNIAGMDGAHGFGMPSGHAQASTFWLLLGSAIRNPWIWTLAIVMALGIGISRFALGAHFPNQVLAGWGLGLIGIWLLYRYEGLILQWICSLSFQQQLASISSICGLILAIGCAVVAFNSSPAQLPEWQQNAQAFIGEGAKLHTISFHGIVSKTGSLFGMLLGLLLIHRYGLGFSDQAACSWQKKTYRALLGFTAVFLCKGLLGSIPLETIGFVGKSWLFLESSLLTLLIFFGVPWIFERTLDKQSPDNQHLENQNLETDTCPK